MDKHEQFKSLMAAANGLIFDFDGFLADSEEWHFKTYRDTFAKYPTTGNVLPAMGYGDEQIRELAETIQATPADVVLVATPIDLRHLIEFSTPALRVRYELQEIGEPTLDGILAEFLTRTS